MKKSLRFPVESVVNFYAEKELGYLSRTYGFFTYQNVIEHITNGGVAMLPDNQEATIDFMRSLVTIQEVVLA